MVRVFEDSQENGETIMRRLEGKAGGGHCGVEMYRVICHPKLLDVVESLTGPEIIGSSVYRIRPKVPGKVRGVVPWHQDSGYFMPLCDNYLVLTVWIPLVDATARNGCMQILPRAHRQGVSTHHTGGNAGFLVIEDQDLPLPPDRAITAECPLGGVVLMTNMTPHSSTPNESDIVRWSIDLRYQGSEVPNNVNIWEQVVAGQVWFRRKRFRWRATRRRPISSSAAAATPSVWRPMTSSRAAARRLTRSRRSPTRCAVGNRSEPDPVGWVESSKPALPSN